MKINRWWYSKKQKKLSNNLRGYNHVCKVKVNDKWCEYSEWTTSPNGKCNWDDAILVAESIGELPIMINGVYQSSC